MVDRGDQAHGVISTVNKAGTAVEVFTLRLAENVLNVVRRRTIVDAVARSSRVLLEHDFGHLPRLLECVNRDVFLEGIFRERNAPARERVVIQDLAKGRGKLLLRRHLPECDTM